MAKRGAPVGNTNNSKGKEWTDAIRYALANYENSDISRGKALKAIALKVVEKALEGDDGAIDEIANRLDGKPAQALTGPDGGPILHKVQRVIVRD